MPTERNNRLGSSPILTERLWASFASAAVRKVQLGHDMTDEELAENIGCSAATVGNARNLKMSGQRYGQLEGRTFANLMRVDPLALESVLHHFGRRSVPIEARCDTDELVSTASAVHKLALAKSPDSKGGVKVTDCECLDLEPELDAAIEALSALKQRCLAIRNGAAA